MSYIDPVTGELRYDAGDARGPMHTVLNQGQEASRIARTVDRQRLDALEQRFAGMDASSPWAQVARNAPFTAQPDAGEVLSYRRRGDICYVEGVLKTTGTAGANFAIMATMPVGYRPMRQVFTLARNTNDGSVVRVRFLPGGEVQLFGTVPANSDVTFVPLSYFLT